MATTTSTSILSTPQAADDYYTYTEAEVLASDSLLTLDVMANDSGGKSKTLYSIEASEEFIEALKVQDATGEANAQYFNGVKVWIDNGKIMVDVSGADALAALGAQSIADLDAGQQLNLSLAYTIKLGNGTLSVATVSLTITGEGSTQPPELSTIGGDTTGTATEINAMDPDGIEYGVPTSTEGALTISGAAGVQFVAQTDTEGANHWGTFSLDVGGNWTYTTHDAMDFLAADETRTDSFVVQATDGTTQTVMVTIVGTDDEPRVTQMDIEGQVTEGGQLNNDGKLFASGSFTITDPDFAQGFQAGQGVAVDGAIGTLHVTQTSFGPISTFAWTYTVDPSEVENLHLGQDMPLAMQFAVPLTGLGAQMGGVPIYLTIQGTNDVPTITVTPGSLVTEDGLLTAGGKLDIQDNDDGESAFAGPGVSAGTYGQFDLQADGTWSYALNNDDARVQALRVGQSLTDQLVVSSQDGTASATLQVTIQGSNDGPRATADTTTGDENQTLTIDVLANDTDGDNGDVLTVFSAAAPSGKGTATVQGNKVVFDPGTAFDHLAAGQSEDVVVTYTIKDLYGAESSSSVTITLTGTDDGPIARPDTGSGHENETLTIDVLANDSTPDRMAPLTLMAASVPQGQGSVTMDANQVVFNPGTDFDHLAQGATTTVVVSYTVADEHGATATGQATLTITGTNDGPVAQNDSATTGATQSLTLDVLANDSDPDDGDVLTIVGAPSALYGTVSIVDNKLFYDPGTMFANLEPGQLVDEMLHYTIEDATGATSQATATVYLTSQSTDHPIDNITGIDRGAILATITEATTGTIPTISGMVTFTDADVGQPYTVSATGSTYGALTATITANDPTLRELTWTFTADTAAIEALGLDASDINHLLSDPAGFITLDNGLPGGTSQIPLVLIVNGADDAEAVEVNSPPVMATNVDGFDFSVGFSGTLNEDTATPLSWGAFLMDPDGPDEGTFQTTGLEQGQYGTFSYDRSAATWNYTLDERAQALGAGESVTEHYDAVSVDGSLGFAINVAVTGVNDPASISGSATGVVVEDGVTTASGVLTIQDKDTGESKFQAPTNLHGAYGDFTLNTNTGEWGYTLRNADANVQALTSGPPVTDTLTVTSLDGTASQTIAVHITGADEPLPPINSTTTAHVAAGWAIADVGGNLSLDEYTAGPTQFMVPTDLQGRYGSFEFNPDGSWRYTLDNDSDAVKTLLQTFPSDPTQSQDRLVVTSADGSVCEEIVVNIHAVSELGGDNLSGTDFNDQLIASGGISTLSGGAGIDALGSNDFSGGYALLDGGAGNDWLLGTRITQDVFFFGTDLGSDGYQAGIDVIFRFEHDTTGSGGSQPQDYILLDAGIFAGLDIRPDGSLSPDSFKLFTVGDPITSAENGQARIIAVMVHDNPVTVDDPILPGETTTLQDRIDLFYDANGGSFDDATQFATLVMPSSGWISLDASAFRLTGIIGTAGDDVLTGTSSGDLISGLGGDDLLQGLAGNESLFGGNGNDTLQGGDGDDILRGGAGNDTLEGGAGSDQLIGGPGNDTLTGGTGNDRFVFNSPLGNSEDQAGADTITDFTSNGAETDLIVLSAQVFTTVQADANGALADGQVYVLNGNFNPSLDVSDSRIVYVTETGALYYDADGGSLDNAVQFAELTNVPTSISESNFLLA